MIMGGSVHFRKLTWTLKNDGFQCRNLLFQGLFSDAMLIFCGCNSQVGAKSHFKNSQIGAQCDWKTIGQLFGFPPPHLWGLDSKVAEFVPEKQVRKQGPATRYL